MNTIVYGDKVAFIVWKENPEGVVIEDKLFAKSYKNYFDFMFDSAQE